MNIQNRQDKYSLPSVPIRFCHSMSCTKPFSFQSFSDLILTDGADGPDRAHVGEAAGWRARKSQKVPGKEERATTDPRHCH